MFGPISRTLGIRLAYAAAWLKAFAFLEDAPGAPSPGVAAERRAARIASELWVPLGAAVEQATGMTTGERSAAGPHVHRVALRTIRRARRPGEVAPRLMPCLTPLPATSDGRPAAAKARATKRATTRHTAS